MTTTKQPAIQALIVSVFVVEDSEYSWTFSSPFIGPLTSIMQILQLSFQGQPRTLAWWPQWLIVIVMDMIHSNTYLQMNLVSEKRKDCRHAG